MGGIRLRGVGSRDGSRQSGQPGPRPFAVSPPHRSRSVPRGWATRLSLVPWAVRPSGARPWEPARVRPFPDAGTPARTPVIRCRCGCAPHAAWRSWSASPPWPTSPEAPSPRRSSLRPPTPWNALRQRVGCPAGTGSSSSRVPTEARGSASWPNEVSRQVDRRRIRGPGHRLLRHDARLRPDRGAGRRAARVAPGGTLVLQYHSLDTIVRLGQWNALRHGHLRVLLDECPGRHARNRRFQPTGRVAISTSTAARCCWQPRRGARFTVALRQLR